MFNKIMQVLLYNQSKKQTKHQSNIADALSGGRRRKKSLLSNPVVVIILLIIIVSFLKGKIF